MKIYLSGEIHSSWREDIIEGAKALQLPVSFHTPNTDHQSSDDVGEVILGAEPSGFWKDHKSARINAVKIRLGIESADVVVVKFGEKYRQWNAAFDAGYAIAKSKPLIVIHPEEFNHALKEIDSAAAAVARTEGQVVEVLQYLCK